MRRTARRFAGWSLSGVLRAVGTGRAGAAGAVPPSRILVIRIDERVGNVLLTTPLLTELRRRFPEARIEALVSASKRALIEGLVPIVEFRRRDFFAHPVRFWRRLRELRRAGYQAAIDASHWHQFSLSSALLLAWTRAPVRIAHARGQAGLFATHLVPPPAQGENRSEVHVKLRLLQPLGIEAAGAAALTTGLGTTAAAERPILDWLQAQGIRDRRLVGLAPGSRKQDHRAPPTVFAALAAEAVRCGAVPVVLWGPGEESLAAGVASAAGALLAPPTDLAALAALMRRLAVIVTNDTGPMHLAVACGAPTIALFVNSDPLRWGHAFDPHTVVPVDGRPEAEVLEAARLALRSRLGG